MCVFKLLETRKTVTLTKGAISMATSDELATAAALTATAACREHRIIRTPAPAHLLPRRRLRHRPVTTNADGHLRPQRVAATVTALAIIV